MPDKFPKISIVTPSFNQGSFIEESILSVVDQEYPNLEYIVMDGGSTDNTIEIIKKYEKYLKFWVSEKDNGLYDALNKGFQRTSGEIMGWLNSDDLLIKKSLFTLADIFQNNTLIKWVQGYPSMADESGRIVFQRSQRSSRFSFYLKEYHDGVFIQQESTYWRRDLWEKAGSRVSNQYKFAGDFELWMRFYKYAEQYITPALIGTFRMRKGQISQVSYEPYLKECDDIIDVLLKDLPESDLAILNNIKKVRKYPFLYSILDRLGINTRTIKSQPLTVYDGKDGKFITSQ